MLFRVYADRSEQFRATARRMYTHHAYGIWRRNVIGVVPLLAPAALLFGLLAVWPLPIARFMVSPTIFLGLLAFMASYRVPAPFLPAWLRTEIAEGVTPVARPDRWDWAIFALVTPLLAFTMVGTPIYFVLYPNG